MLRRTLLIAFAVSAVTCLILSETVRETARAQSIGPAGGPRTAPTPITAGPGPTLWGDDSRAPATGPVQGTPLPFPVPRPTAGPRASAPLPVVPPPSGDGSPAASGPADPWGELSTSLRDEPSSRGGARISLPGQIIADLAITLVGRPYAWGGASPDAGFDCSGLVYYVYGQHGLAIARDSFSQWADGVPVSQAELQAGDIVFFADTYTDGISHNGIYVGAGRFVHAVGEGSGVRFASLSDEYWTPRYVGARRIPTP